MKEEWNSLRSCIILSNLVFLPNFLAYTEFTVTFISMVIVRLNEITHIKCQIQCVSKKRVTTIAKNDWSNLALKIILYNRKIMWDAYVILNFLVVITSRFLKGKLTLITYLTQYIKEILYINICQNKKLLMRYFTFLFFIIHL